MTFKVENTTKYPTAVIKRVFRAVVADVAVSTQAASSLDEQV